MFVRPVMLKFPVPPVCPEVLLAPVADVLVAIYDDRVALGITFADFWYDALHVNELGYYVAALTHWAVMH